MEIGNKIREVRKRKNISQNQLAEMLGTTQPALAAIESNKRMPKIETLERIAAALGVDILALLPSYVTAEAVSLTTPEEKELFKIMSDLNDTGQKKVLDYATDIHDNKKYCQ